MKNKLKNYPQLANAAASAPHSSASVTKTSSGGGVEKRHAPSLLEARESKLSLPSLCDSAAEDCWKARLKVKKGITERERCELEREEDALCIRRRTREQLGR